MSLTYTIKCRDCPNTIEIENGKGTANKRYCDPCLAVRKKISSVKKNRYQRAQRVYPVMLRNLTKNYILFMEGVKK